ncbi:MAG: T9SS type A sorting domain-containing protein [Bacteroidales bacterium]|nr:T9SS type A sorting domain-containing protein [Bacteroidales bacterium]
MKKLFVSLFLLVLVAVSALVWLKPLNNNTKESDQLSELKPNDWMLMQRMYPYDKINPDAYDQSRQQAIQIRKDAARFKTDREDWESVGPYNVGGRVTDIEMHPTDPETIYVGAASGGVFKSLDKGKTWTQIFENEYTQSIGDLAIAETDKNILYLGTGEPNDGQGSITYDGYGVFKSTNGGSVWTPMGLENAGGIGRVEVDPTNADRVFVAAMGNLFSNNPERGVYRTTNGGQTWENVLYISDSTGAIDLCINHSNPNIIYAGMWERVRGPYHRTYGGPSTGLYRSTDGGDTWTQLTNGLPTGSMGRIGLGISRSQPDILYASYAKTSGSFEDVYKTTDGGDTWTDLNSGISASAYSWWFSKVQVHPNLPDVVWVEDFRMMKSVDGGLSWANVDGLHVDQHALYSHPMESNFVVIGNDGGVYLSENGTQTNSFVVKLPMTQFYTCEVDFQHPTHRFGGTQDNGTQGTVTGQNNDWSSIYGGDGFVVRIDPTDNRYVYASSQRGGFGRSTDGGNGFRGARPANGDRYNWKTPYILDPNDPKILYLGSHRVYKSTNRANSWTRISNDLTNGDAGSWNYATLTALAVSKLNGDILFAGSDDGNVWVNTDGGATKNWTKISDNLPVRWVTTLATDPFDANTAYVGFSGIRYHDFEPHLFRTTDLGATWEDISANLPDVPVNNVTIDPDNQGTFYVATDNGVFVTYDAGINWEVLGNGLPTVPVLDLNIHAPTRILLAATFGRSQYQIKVKASSGTAVIEQEKDILSAYPNPAVDEINFSFSLSQAQNGKLLIYDMNGRIIKTLFEGELTQGTHNFTWDGTTKVQSHAAGTYICRLVTNKTILAKRIQILK